jgi:hypothetical protein
MFEPAGRVCEDPARRARKEGSPQGRGGGARFLADFFAAQQRSRSPAGARPGQRRVGRSDGGVGD